MSTVGAMIERVHRDLYGSHRAVLNRLDAAITTTDTALVTEFSTNEIAEGDYLAIEDEVLYVWDFVEGTKTATVQRAMQGSTAVAHSDATLIEIGPRFPRGHIRQAMLDEIRSWPNSLFATDSLAASMTAGDRAISTSSISGYKRVLEVLRNPWTDAEDTKVELAFREERSANAIYLTHAIDSAVTVTIYYAKAFDVDPFTDAIDLQTDVGLTAGMEDIVLYGAQWRLIAPRETRRSDTQAQGESRNASEVPSDSAMRTAARLKAIRDERIIDEAERLISVYPWRRR